MYTDISTPFLYGRKPRTEYFPVQLFTLLSLNRNYYAVCYGLTSFYPGVSLYLQ